MSLDTRPDEAGSTALNNEDVAAWLLHVCCHSNLERIGQKCQDGKKRPGRGNGADAVRSVTWREVPAQCLALDNILACSLMDSKGQWCDARSKQSHNSQ